MSGIYRLIADGGLVSFGIDIAGMEMLSIGGGGGYTAKNILDMVNELVKSGIKIEEILDDEGNSMDRMSFTFDDDSYLSEASLSAFFCSSRQTLPRHF